MKKTFRILIAEDSEDDALLVLHQIRKGGYDIEHVRVETAEEMKLALKEKAWDIVLSDYQMPHFNGLEALEILKDSGIDLPFIIISGTIGEDVAVEAMKAGAHDYIMKNNLQRLFPAVERELRESRNRAERKRAEHEIIRMNRTLRMLSDTNQALIKITDEASLLNEVCRIAVDAGGYLLAWVGFVEPDKAKTLRPVAHAGIDSNYIESASIDWADYEHDRGPCGTAVRSGQPCIVRNLPDDPNYAFWQDAAVHRGFNSVIALPLLSENQVLGVLGIYSGETDAFDTKEVEILKEQAEDLAFGIASLRIKDKKLQAEESLHLLSTALEASANSVVITDNKSTIIWANEAFSRLSGYDLNEAIGKKPRDLVYSGIHPREFYQHMWETILSGNVWHGEIINKQKNGQLYNEFLTITPVHDENNEIRHFIAVKQDITKQKKSEEELRAAKEKAEESNKLKSAFLATMNHELRTPLNHILGFSDLLRSGAILEQVIDYSNVIYKSGQNLLEIIEDIFELAIAEQSEIKLRQQTFKCLELFLSNKSVLTEILEISGKKDRIDLVFNVDKELLLQNITTDRNKINQVLINLFKNAVKFTKSGKIEFGLKEEEPGWLTFYVEDSGIGIPEDKHEIVFEFFRQADDSHTREYGGIGIGLAISKKIAEVMHGSLSLESVPKKGSRFCLKIPVAISDFEDIQIDDYHKEIIIPKFHGKTILIAEDDHSSVILIKNYLANTGAKLIEAANGKEVIEKLDLHPDVILMDLNMPIMDGYAATRIVKSKNRGIPVIAVTAYALSADKTKAIDAGCDSIISKPVEQKILFSELNKFLLTD